jgi:multiple sugar transport system ATP-binding protein
VRPTDLRLAASGIPGRVIIVEPTGAETELLVEVGGQQMVVVIHGRTQAQPGDPVHLEFDVAKSHVFDAASGLRLG